MMTVINDNGIDFFCILGWIDLGRNWLGQTGQFQKIGWVKRTNFEKNFLKMM